MVHNFYEFKFVQYITFNVSRVSRSIAEDEEVLERQIFLQKVLFQCWSENKPTHSVKNCLFTQVLTVDLQITFAFQLLLQNFV